MGAAGLGCIFTTQLTIMGSSFQVFSIELLEWGRNFWGLESKKIICPKVTKIGSLISYKIDYNVGHFTLEFFPPSFQCWKCKQNLELGERGVFFFPTLVSMIVWGSDCVMGPCK